MSNRTENDQTDGKPTPSPDQGATADAQQTRTTLHELSDAGVSVWLDDLNRPMIADGDLTAYIDRGVLGVTTNPTIFAAALAGGEAYTEQVSGLAGSDVDEVVHALTTEDVRNACDVFLPIYARTGGQDGRVSIEVDPRLAKDTAATVEMARRLWTEIDRPNLLVKIPATVEGLPAISQALAEGISVNVTLIFSLDRYRGVMNAYLTGLEQARERGGDLSSLRSVASFFVSRVDSEIDKRLETIGTEEALALRGKAGLANARLAYQAFEEVFSTPRWQNLADDGAHVQRPLWASTGVKNPDYPDTLYVTELVAHDTVNTMPAATLEAAVDHGQIGGDTITGGYAEAQQVLDSLERVGVTYTEVVELLETEGVEKFETSWLELLATVQGELDKASGDGS
ncbi:MULTISPECIES: transaldolase [unclassified Ornithinimicrobium]|uniref:transaldolase n=1 Tax=unclassified Ornithinimicrobium TaxID=2615080 RepID=UPI0038530CB1